MAAAGADGSRERHVFMSSVWPHKNDHHHHNKNHNLGQRVECVSLALDFCVGKIPKYQITNTSRCSVLQFTRCRNSFLSKRAHQFRFHRLSALSLSPANNIMFAHHYGDMLCVVHGFVLVAGIVRRVRMPHSIPAALRERAAAQSSAGRKSADTTYMMFDERRQKGIMASSRTEQ